MALIKQGKQGRGGAAVRRDRRRQHVPETIRSRAVQIAGTLGVDATASLPAASPTGLNQMKRSVDEDSHC